MLAITQNTHSELSECALRYFSQKFFPRSTPRVSPRALLRAIDLWWFVPRSDDALRSHHERVAAALREYSALGTLPPYVVSAYTFAISGREEELLSHR